MAEAASAINAYLADDAIEEDLYARNSRIIANAFYKRTTTTPNKVTVNNVIVKQDASKPRQRALAPTTQTMRFMNALLKETDATNHTNHTNHTSAIASVGIEPQAPTTIASPSPTIAKGGKVPKNIKFYMNLARARGVHIKPGANKSEIINAIRNLAQ